MLCSETEYCSYEIPLVMCQFCLFCETGSSDECRGSSAGDVVDDDDDEEEDAEGKLFTFIPSVGAFIKITFTGGLYLDEGGWVSFIIVSVGAWPVSQSH